MCSLLLPNKNRKTTWTLSLKKQNFTTIDHGFYCSCTLYTCIRTTNFAPRIIILYIYLVKSLKSTWIYRNMDRTRIRKKEKRRSRSKLFSCWQQKSQDNNHKVLSLSFNGFLVYFDNFIYPLNNDDGEGQKPKQHNNDDYVAILATFFP